MELYSLAKAEMRDISSGGCIYFCGRMPSGFDHKQTSIEFTKVPPADVGGPDKVGKG